MNRAFRDIKNVAFIGEAMIELRLDSANSASVACAGDTLNTSVYLKRMWPTGNVSYVTALGVEAVSDRIMAFMQAENLDTTHIVRLNSYNAGLYAISTDKTGERSFAYWRENSAARQMFSQASNLNLSALAEHDMIYLSAISLAILPEQDREKLQGFLSDYRASGGLVAFDSNYRPSLWSSPEIARNAVRCMWQMTDLALPSLDDEMALFDDRNEEAVVARLVGWGACLGALKRGSAGPRSLANDCPDAKFPPVDLVKDSTAAGDSFNAGFIATLILGGSVRECLDAGHKLACHVIARSGAIVPTGDENE